MGAKKKGKKSAHARASSAKNEEPQPEPGSSSTKDATQPEQASPVEKDVPQSKQSSSTEQGDTQSEQPPSTNEKGKIPKWNLKFRYQDEVSPSKKRFVDSLVWKDCQVNAIKEPALNTNRAGSSGNPTRVVTNYVTIDKVPPKIYVYTVRYTGRKTKQEERTDEEASTDTRAVLSDVDFPKLGDVRNSLPGLDEQTNSNPGKKDDQADSNLIQSPSSAPDTEADDNSQQHEIKRRNEKRCIWKALKEGEPPFCIRKDWATNDNDTVWSLRPLFDQDCAPSEGEIQLISNVSYKKFTGRKSVVDLEFTFNRTLDFANGSNSVVSGPKTNRGGSMHITALNGLMSKHAIANEDIISTGPNKFYLKEACAKIEPLNAHRGYSSSVRPGAENILLNVGTITGAFIPPLAVGQLLDFFTPPKFNEYGDRTKLLVGKTVRLAYDRSWYDDDFNPNLDDNRHKTISEFGEVPSVQTFKKDGEDVAVSDYFVQSLRAQTPTDQYPCVNVGLAKRSVNEHTQANGNFDPSKSEIQNKSIWIPADFMELDPHQAFNRRLCATHMEGMLQVAQHEAADTHWLIAKEGLKLLGLTQNDAASRLRDLGLMIKNRNLLEIPARFLSTPQIIFGSTGIDKTKDAIGASWNLRDVVFYKTPTISQLQGVVALDCTTHSVTDSIAGDLANQLVRHGIGFIGGRGPRYNRLRLQEVAREYWRQWNITGDPPLSISDCDDSTLYRMLEPHCNKDTMYLILLSDKDSANYARIKRVFGQHHGFHSVCLTAEKFWNSKMGIMKSIAPATLSNLALKVNMKLRGQNHQVCDSTRSSRDKKVSMFENIATNTIVLGADVSHAPSQMDHCPSVAAVVGSDDSEFANFPGSMRLQAMGQEIIEDLASMVSERVVRWVECRREFPIRMIFYRDGVGEDQYEKVKTTELERIKGGISMAKKEATRMLPRFNTKSAVEITLIVVGKRHNTRFFSREDGQRTSETNGNVKPGLIVDTIITRPRVDPIFDFFLQSHQALQGTAKSAHYVVLQKGASLTVNQIQLLTHGFCYNYGRATKGVSYAGPAYYADRLCERGTHYLKAYTNVHAEPPPMEDNDDEKRNRDKKLAMKNYQRRIAREISRSPEWNPRHQSRPNPWHPNFDNCMFWL